MATLNAGVHGGGIIHYTNRNPNSRYSCQHSRSLAFKRPSLFPNWKLHSHSYSATTTTVPSVSAVASSVKEVLPPPLDSSSEQPAIFDGTPKLYISYSCPYAQRAWITRNCKGLQETIKLVPIDLKNRPAWYKEKVYPENKVPSLEHNNEVKGESLDLIRYIDITFEGPSLFPSDPAKREFGEELLAYTGPFYTAVTTSFKENTMNDADAAFDELERGLSKYNDGPFFLGPFSLVDVAYVPFIERFQAFLSEVKNLEVTSGRPKLALWIEEMNKIEGYKQTKRDPKEYIESFSCLPTLPHERCTVF